VPAPIKVKHHTTTQKFNNKVRTVGVAGCKSQDPRRNLFGLFDRLDMEDIIDLTVSSDSEDINLPYDIIDDGTLVSLARPTPRHNLGL
jgi:hypothetical protein